MDVRAVRQGYDHLTIDWQNVSLRKNAVAVLSTLAPNKTEAYRPSTTSNQHNCTKPIVAANVLRQSNFLLHALRATVFTVKQ